MATFNSVNILIIAVLFGLFSCSEQTDQVTKSEPKAFQCDEDNGGLSLPEGFCAKVIADHLGFVRHLVAHNNGDVFITLRNHRLNLGGLLQLRDADNDGQIELVEKIHDIPGMGIAIKDDYVYFAADDAIYRYLIKQGEIIKHDDAELVVSGFPEQELHAGKTITIGANDDLFVNVGSKSNACQLRDLQVESPGLDPCPELQEHAGIWRFDASKITQDFSDGEQYALGIRNSYAKDWHPIHQTLFVVQHGRDQLAYLWPEHYQAQDEITLPAEEMFSVEQGKTYSWPYCYYDPVVGQRILAPEYGGDGKEQGLCADYAEPLIGFPAHFGPNDLLIYTGQMFPSEYVNGAFIAFHGHHSDEHAHQVVFVPANEQGLSSNWQVFAENAVIETEEGESLEQYRPTGLALTKNGALLLSDSVQGRVWQIIYEEAQNQ